MSSFLVNCSNLKVGGGLQVADSICGQLLRYEKHLFIVVLSSYLEGTRARINKEENVVLYRYDIPDSFRSIVMGRDTFLDELVEKHNVDAVLTVFGPSRWRPKVPHLSGFALPQLVIPESPYFKYMGWVETVKWKLWRGLRKWSLKRSTDYFWTENPYVSKRLSHLLQVDDVRTVSNYYNQVFDMPDAWCKHSLPKFDGTTCLSVSSYYPHKNFKILVDVARVLSQKRPDFRCRFVLTFDENLMTVPDDVKHYFLFVGKVDVSECPDLYKQADIMFMPSLLECFTATYPEAMRMEVPIVTTDLEFARGLCGEAACYYSAVDANAAAEAIYKVATDNEYAAKLVSNGKEQLKKFDDYEQRADKLVGILESMVKES